MRIGIFGGSFNPPHKMHERIAKELINKHIVDKVVFVPTGRQYKYKSNLIDDAKRYSMLKIITDKNKNLMVSDYELKDEVVYTCETLAYFKKKYAEDEICFICGTDNLSYIDKWKNGEEILRNYKIIVIDRTGNNLVDLLDQFKEYKDNIVVSSLKKIDLSSTEIRDLLRMGKYDEVCKYLDKDVLDYIIKENLYVS